MCYFLLYFEIVAVFNRVMFSTESVSMAGVSINANPTTLVTSKGVPSTDTGTSVLTVDFETKPLTIKADSVLSVTAEPVDVFYHEVSKLLWHHHVCLGRGGALYLHQGRGYP